MIRSFLVALAIAGLQSPSPTPSPKTVTLSGCVSSVASGPVRYMLTDSDGGTYHLSGTDVHRYLGRRVEVTGGVESKRVHIVGGLLPNPNVAGQAGAIDPAQAAMADGGAGSAGQTPMPTFKVARVHAVEGACPER